ncbi:hypothetical protein TELCIR_16680, partial [Teladorsagia circumcincta]
VGFRARYEFVDEKEWSDRPNARDCDEFLEGYGGEIKLDGNQQLINTYVDCIWIIGRFPHMARTFDRIYLKIEEFHMKGVGLRLEIREGASSTSDRLLLLFDSQTRDQVQHKQPRHGFATTSSSPAFYIRLRGYLMGSSGLEIVYTQFYRWATALCPGIGEFHCDNARCIKVPSSRASAFLNRAYVNSASEERMARSPTQDVPPRDPEIDDVGDPSSDDASGEQRSESRASLASTLREGGDQPTTSATPYPADPAAPSIQTVGERRFYVVPESQISVIEAPPSYDDALKHPPVPSSRASAFLNRAYVNSASEERMARSPTQDVPPRDPEIDDVGDPRGDDASGEQRSESRASLASTVREGGDQPTTSGTSPNLQRKDDESWV